MLTEFKKTTTYLTFIISVSYFGVKNFILSDAVNAVSFVLSQNWFECVNVHTYFGHIINQINTPEQMKDHVSENQHYLQTADVWRDTLQAMALPLFPLKWMLRRLVKTKHIRLHVTWHTEVSFQHYAKNVDKALCGVKTFHFLVHCMTAAIAVTYRNWMREASRFSSS